MNNFNTEDDRPRSSTSIRNREFVASGIILAIGAIVAIYFFTRQNTSSEVAVPSFTPTATLAAVSLPVISNSANSPVSPISPVKPHSTSPDQATLDALFETGFSHYEAGEYEAALNSFNEMLALDPLNARALDARGTILTDQGKLEQAVADYTKAIEADPLYPPAYYNRGRVYGLQKKYDQAIADLRKSFELAPFFFGYRANGNIGRIYHQQGEYDKALEAFAAAISFDDSKADTYYLRGETYTAMGNYEAAISDYEAAISRFSKYSQAYQSLGYARYKTGQFDQALEALDKAIELSPESPTLHFYRMLVYLDTHQVDKTKAEVTQGMETIGTLPEEEQDLLFKRILGDLESFAQENPAQAKDVEALVNLIPPQ
jgi:tetratricopeptide (TPR) repeat protein